MAFHIRRAEYFYAKITDEPEAAFRFLSQLAELGVDLLAFTAVPVGPATTQLTLFPADIGVMAHAAEQSGLGLDGPHPALIVHGDDELGALAGIHEKLSRASVSVFASSGVTDGRGTFGYVLYVRPEQFDKAARALEV